MPGASDNDVPEPGVSSREKAESAKLWLPSHLSSIERDAICSGDIVSSERELRFGQLDDALNELRKVRRIRHGLITFHKVQLAGEGQKTQTKSRAVMQTIQDRINRSVQRYRIARSALLQLDPSGSWQDLYRPLDDCDNRGPWKEPDEISASDGQFVPSWIWLSNPGMTAGDPQHTAVSQDEVNDDMRVEWAQCIARADRWEEEVTLLQEEMRRVVQFMEWKSNDWAGKVDARVGDVTLEVSLGLSAYARKQASIFRHLAVQFCQRWRLKLISLSLPDLWATEFLTVRGIPLDVPDPKKQKKRGPRNQAYHPNSPVPPPDAGPPPINITAPQPILAELAAAPGDGTDNDDYTNDSHDNNGNDNPADYEDDDSDYDGDPNYNEDPDYDEYEDSSESEYED